MDKFVFINLYIRKIGFLSRSLRSHFQNSINFLRTNVLQCVLKELKELYHHQKELKELYHHQLVVQTISESLLCCIYPGFPGSQH